MNINMNVNTNEQTKHIKKRCQSIFIFGDKNKENFFGDFIKVEKIKSTNTIVLNNNKNLLDFDDNNNNFDNNINNEEYPSIDVVNSNSQIIDNINNNNEILNNLNSSNNIFFHEKDFIFDK